MTDVIFTRWERVQKITTCYQESVGAIVDVGRYLIQAKEQLTHGEFGSMVADDLPFSWRTANCFIAIAKNPTLANSHHGANLPTSWRTLSELARLPQEVLEEALDDGRITPELQRKDVALLKPVAFPRPTPEPQTSAVVNLADLVAGGKKFGTVYADPPWPYDNQATRAATDNHYHTLSLAEIAKLPVNELAASDAHLHLWATNAFLFDSKALLEAWGFEFKGVLLWIKPQIGIGNYWRVAHEFLLLGVRGNSPFRDRSQRSWFEEGRRAHSEKPDTVRAIIQKVSPPSYLELFGRKQVDGWTVWGDQAV